MDHDHSAAAGDPTASAGPGPADATVSRRQVLAGASLLGAAAALGIDLSGCSSDHGPPYRALSPHQAAVVEDATARLIPGPRDDPAEAGHPGAREANVVGYIDTMLGALHHDPALVYAGGPFSDRNGHDHDDMADFVDLPTTVRQHWQDRLRGFERRYHRGIRDLDRLAGGNFVRASAARQDKALAQNPHGFTDLLFEHAIEGCYAVPEYQGNAHLVGWREIKFPGDSQPRGYTDHEVSRSDGRDPLAREGVVDRVLTLLESTSPASTSKPNLVGRAGH